MWHISSMHGHLVTIPEFLEAIKKNIYLLSLNKKTTAFDWVAGNYNKDRTKQ